MDLRPTDIRAHALPSSSAADPVASRRMPVLVVAVLMGRRRIQSPRLWEPQISMLKALDSGIASGDITRGEYELRAGLVWEMPQALPKRANELMRENRWQL